MPGYSGCQGYPESLLRAWDRRSRSTVRTAVVIRASSVTRLSSWLWYCAGLEKHGSLIWRQHHDVTILILPQGWHMLPHRIHHNRCYKYQRCPFHLTHVSFTYIYLRARSLKVIELVGTIPWKKTVLQLSSSPPLTLFKVLLSFNSLQTPFIFYCPLTLFTPSFNSLPYSPSTLFTTAFILYSPSTLFTPSFNFNCPLTLFTHSFNSLHYPPLFLTLL